MAADPQADAPASAGVGVGAAAAGAEAAVAWPGRAAFQEVQELLDRNALLIAQINANHGTRAPDALERNLGLIRELNANVGRVVDLYQQLAGEMGAAAQEGGGGGGGGEGGGGEPGSGTQSGH